MRRSCGAPKAERSKGRRTSSCARATHGDERCGGARAAPCVVRHREARRARAAPDRCRDGSRVRVGGGGHEDHRRRPDDDPVDRPVPRGPGRHRPRAHPRVVRGRPHGDRAAGGRAGREGTQRPASDPGGIGPAVAAGAELVLSINGSNREVARELAGSETRVVVIPDFGQGLETLEPSVAALEQWGVSYLIDPVIEPIGFGFMRSLERYAETRRRHPYAPLFMGVGNITELTAADTTGVNALLLAVCQELGVRAVLTTEVIPWARGAVREIDVARRLMYHAVTRKALPKGVDDRLVTVKDPAILAYADAELRELQRAVTDPNYRIFTDRDSITVFNNERFVRGTDIHEIFAQLDVDEATHAFYLGRELMKAKLAITLGKTYRQEGALQWGYLTPPDDRGPEHVKLTQRSARARARTGRAKGSR